MVVIRECCSNCCYKFVDDKYLLYNGLGFLEQVWRNLFATPVSTPIPFGSVVQGVKHSMLVSGTDQPSLFTIFMTKKFIKK